MSIPKKRGQSGDSTKLNRIDFAGIPPITVPEARACAVALSGASITIGADPVDLREVLMAAGIFHFLKESS